MTSVPTLGGYIGDPLPVLMVCAAVIVGAFLIHAIAILIDSL